MTKIFELEVPGRVPDEFTVDEYIDRLLFEERMERGRQQHREGKPLTHTEVVNHFAESWPKQAK